MADNEKLKRTCKICKKDKALYLFEKQYNKKSTMKKMKRIILTATTMAMFMSAVIFSACTKSSNGNQCANVTCQNGGACINGGCSCITGYIGSYCQTPATTTIQYTNDTYTPIKITANGTNSTIPVGGSISYTGPYNTTLDYTAYTYGATSTGTQIFISF